MKRGSLLVVGILTCLLLIQVAAAEMTLTQPKSRYNLGDELLVEVDIIAEEDMNAVFELSISCSGNEKTFYSEMLALSDGESKKIAKTLTLTDSFLEGMTGICHIKANYAEEEAKTTNFEVSGEIDISVSLNKKNFEPSDTINIEGTAIKNLGQVSGTAEARIDKFSLKSISTVSDSKFSLNLSIPDGVESGECNLEIRVYEKDKIGQISNQGSIIETINIKQIPKKIDIETDKQSYKPNEEVILKVQFYDQTNKKIIDDAILKLYDSYNEEVFEKLVKTDTEESFELEKSASSGYWKAEATGQNLETTRLFYVEELEEASFEIANDTLIITNIGNVIYKKTVQIEIGDELEIKTLDLGIDESKKFRLVAPDGRYSISVTDGTTTFSKGGVALTGNVVGVLDVRKQLNIITKYPIVWLFLVVVAGLFILMLVERTARKKILSYIPSKIIKAKQEKTEGKENIETGVEDVNQAKHELVLKGRKEKAGILALKVKNKEEDPKVMEAIKKSLSKLYNKKGKTYVKGKEIIGILTPSLTKTFKNELTAVKVAQEISKSLEEYNKTAEKKIDFGIGIHSGDLAVRVENGNLKFTSLGNSLSQARHLSDKANKDILLSKKATDKLGSEVRVEKSGEGFKIKRVVDREQHAKFIQDFLKRIEGK